MRRKITYIAEDGAEFHDKNDCETYEANLNRRREFINNEIEAYDFLGQPLDTSSKRWFDNAETIVINTRVAGEALGEIMTDDDEPYYDCYAPDFGEYILKELRDVEYFPLVFSYIDDDLWSADDPNGKVSGRCWYNMNSLMYRTKKGANIVFKTDPDVKEK